MALLFSKSESFFMNFRMAKTRSFLASPSFKEKSIEISSIVGKGLKSSAVEAVKAESSPSWSWDGWVECGFISWQSWQSSS